MATKVTLEISERDTNNKKITETIAYVNPTATNEQLQELATKFAALTTNTMTSLKKITEEDI